jgi:hypothetical protein
MSDKPEKINLADKIRLTGKVRAVVRDSKTDRILQVVETANLVVTAGKELVAALLNDENIAVPNYCAVGSGTTTPADTDTALEAETGRLQVTQRSRSGNQLVYSTFFSASDANGDWNECGLFNADSGGTMLCRALFSATIAKDSTKTVTVDWIITVG